MYISAALSAAFLATAVLAQTPANFTPSASSPLAVSFGNTTITPGLVIDLTGMSRLT